MIDSVFPNDLTALDAFAFVWFLGLWGAFNVVQDRLLHRGVNHHLVRIRRYWMERMMERHEPMPDTLLIGHSMQSCTFFASTTALMLAGLVGWFGMADRAQKLLEEVSFARPTSLALFELKLLVLGCIFIFAFFKFTWSLRQFNYCVALIGSAPLAPLKPEWRRRCAKPIAGMLSLALGEFNSGIRAYYFALAALSWLSNPWLFIVAVTGVVAILSRRQLHSRPERLLREHLTNLDEIEF